MNHPGTFRGESRGTNRRLAIPWLLLALQALWLNPAHANAALRDLEIEEQAGAFVLELDTPSPRTRGKCIDIVVSNFAAARERKLWLVVRSMERGQAGARPAYETVTLVAAPANRVGNTQVCPPRAPEAVRAQGHGAVVMQVAVYGVTERELAAGSWSGPADDGMRLSNWLSLPDTVLRIRMPIADRSSKSRAAP